MPLSILGRYSTACPVCKQEFTAIACVQANSRGGVDRDLFERALGPQPEFYRIATCPRCGYSGYDRDFDPGVQIPPDLRDRILVSPKLKLPDGFTPASDPRELDATDRYALAVTCYQWRGRSDEALAWLHLRASWVAREEGATLPRDLRLAKVMAFIERWKPLLRVGQNQTDVEMQLATRVAEAVASGQFNRYQSPYVELALSLILRRHGENRFIRPVLNRLAGCSNFEPPLHDGITRMRASLEPERRQQLEAAAAFERALLADAISAANRPAAKYLLAELYRRLERDAEAGTWYRAALAEQRLPAELRAWATEQLGWVTGDESLP